MLYSHCGLWLVLAGARPAQTLIHCKNGPEPAGMFMRGSPQPSFAIPGGSPTPWLITSCGIDSLVQSMSPSRHSPNAMVLLVPSVMSRTPIAGTPLEDWKLALSPPPNMKIPFGRDPPLEPTQCKLEPTEAK